ncbi:MAG TPA: MoaD/ThiS family protein [Nitrososphaera sp.]|jgi:molybdopterin converting factor subunit 1
MDHFEPRFVTLRIKLFAILREIVGKEQMTLQLLRDDGETSVANLRKKILELHPEISARRIPFAIAVNAKVADERQVIDEDDEIAFLPPISGG